MWWGLTSLTAPWRRPAVAAVRPAAQASRGRGEWRRVPALRLTIKATPVLVGGTLLGLPDVGGTRTLVLARPDQARVRPAVAAGRMAGILVPHKPPQAGQAPANRPGPGGSVRGEQAALAVAEQAPEPAGPPARPGRRMVTPATAAVQRPVLVRAAGEFVGDPLAEERPYASSAWLRMVQAYRPWPAEPEPSPNADSASFDPGVPGWSSSAEFEPPRAAPSPSATAPAAGQEHQRRASLAESRRLGLGRPFRPAPPGGDQPPADLSAEDGEVPDAAPAEPDEPLAAKVRASHIRRLVPPGLGLGAPITLRGSSPGGARPAAGPVPVPPSSRPDGPQPASATAGGDLAPAAGPRSVRSGRAVRPGVTEPGASAGQVETTSFDPAEPVAPATTRPLTVTPVYRAAGHAPRVAADRVPAAGRGQEPLVHRQAGVSLAAPEAPAPQAAPPGTGVPPPEVREQVPDQPGSGAPWAREPAFPPYDLADALRRLHGVDVSDVIVSRGPEARPQARAIGARAFAREGEVVLPDEAGPTERPETRALLAHELTHAAQQRVMGVGLPPEDSAAGAALEDQAVLTERLLLGRPRNREPSSLHQAGEATVRNPAPSSPPQELFYAPPRAAVASSLPGAGTATAAPVQRQADDIPSSPTIGNAFDPFALLPQQGPSPAPESAALTGAASPASPPAGLDEGLAQARGRLLELAEQRLLDLDDSVAMGELADGIYQRLRARLQRELLVDRERSGLLSDFR